ncbi:TAXI family TRAP transporter solute-binding subunit [Thermodesulfobacteriota bacterium]
MKRLFLVPLLIVVVAGLTATAVPSLTAAAPKLPPLIVATGLTTGSAFNTRLVGVSETIGKLTSMRVQIEPGGTEVSRFAPLHLGDAQLNLAPGGEAYRAFIGDLKAVGPIQLRRVWAGSPSVFTVWTRGNSGIKTIADLAGKRVPQSKSGISWSRRVRAALAFGGLTLNDVKVVNVASIPAGMKGILEGTIDITWTSDYSGFAIETAASRHGIHLFEFPLANTEGWKRIRDTDPTISWVKAKGAAGLAPGQTLETVADEQGLHSTPKTSDDIIYAVCKAMYEGYDTYKNMEKDLVNWTWQAGYTLGVLEIPYHDGTIKFFKEKGVWTAAHEKFQQQALSLEKARLGK